MNHISPYRCVGWLSGALRQFCNFNLSFCVFFFLNKISRRTLGNYIYMCVIVLSYRWIILENNNIDSLYFFELIEFYKENILTSWNICLAKEVRFFSPFYFCLSILRTELNEIWQHVEGNNTLSYILSFTYKSCFSDNFEKNIWWNFFDSNFMSCFIENEKKSRDRNIFLNK